MTNTPQNFNLGVIQTNPGQTALGGAKLITESLGSITSNLNNIVAQNEKTREFDQRQASVQNQVAIKQANNLRTQQTADDAARQQQVMSGLAKQFSENPNMFANDKPLQYALQQLDQKYQAGELPEDKYKAKVQEAQQQFKPIATKANTVDGLTKTLLANQIDPSTAHNLATTLAQNTYDQKTALATAQRAAKNKNDYNEKIYKNKIDIFKAIQTKNGIKTSKSGNYVTDAQGNVYAKQNALNNIKYQNMTMDNIDDYIKQFDEDTSFFGGKPKFGYADQTAAKELVVDAVHKGYSLPTVLNALKVSETVGSTLRDKHIDPAKLKTNLDIFAQKEAALQSLVGANGQIVDPLQDTKTAWSRKFLNSNGPAYVTPGNVKTAPTKKSVDAWLQALTKPTKTKTKTQIGKPVSTEIKGKPKTVSVIGKALASGKDNHAIFRLWKNGKLNAALKTATPVEKQKVQKLLKSPLYQKLMNQPKSKSLLQKRQDFLKAQRAGKPFKITEVELRKLFPYASDSYIKKVLNEQSTK